MKLQFKNPGYDYMLEAILEFQGEDQGEFFRESLYMFYPNFEKERMNSLDTEGKKEYIGSELKQIYEDNVVLLEEKIKAYQAHWDNNKEVIQKTFEEIFDMKLENDFNFMVG